MATTEAVQRLKARADTADEIITHLKHQLSVIKQAKATSQCSAAEKKLQEENETLKKEVERLKRELTLAEIHNGVKQVFTPINRNVTHTPGDAAVPDKTSAQSSDKQTEWKKNKDGKKAGNMKDKQADKDYKTKTKKEKSNKPTAAPADVKIDASRLDLKVGHIVSATKHPDADRLYVETVNLGEEQNRTVVSGLAGKVPLEEMQDRLAVFMLNLKPVKMLGIQSEAMIMCVTDGNTVEILVPPPGAAIGDRVTCPEYEGTPDAQLNPKKKIWEQIKPDMKTTADKEAAYKGAVFTVAGKGPLTAPSISNGQIS